MTPSKVHHKKVKIHLFVFHLYAPVAATALADPGYTKENGSETSVSGVLRVRALALEGVLPRSGVARCLRSRRARRETV